MDRKPKLYDRDKEPEPADIYPDRSMSDFYCRACDAHMSTEQMWESHISGKRHLKNVKKKPGELPSKLKAIKLNSTPKLMDAIQNINEPLVGLEYMTELQRADDSLNPSYTCHLCHANLTWSIVIKHILETKHRMAYLKILDAEQHEAIENADLSKGALDRFAEDKAREYERKLGCGTMEVKLEKPKIVPPQMQIKKEKLDEADSPYRQRSPSKERSPRDRYNRYVKSRRSRSRSNERSSSERYNRYVKSGRSRSRSKDGSSSERYNRYRKSRRSRSRSRSKTPSKMYNWYVKPRKVRSASRERIRSPKRRDFYSRASRSRSTSRESNGCDRHARQYAMPPYLHRKRVSPADGKWRHDRYSPSPPRRHFSNSRNNHDNCRDVNSLTILEKLEYLKRTSKEIVISSDSEVADIGTTISILSRQILTRIVQQFPIEKQNRVAKFLVKSDVKNLQKEIQSSLDFIFQAVLHSTCHSLPDP